MDVAGLLRELYGRLPDLVRAAVTDLTPDRLGFAPAAGANPAGWLVWHLSRVQDHHVAALLGADQLWVAGGWAPRFGLDPDPENTGYGHTPDEVAAVRPESWQVLVEYHAAVHERTADYLAGLTPADLDRVVDRAWDPPVTLGVRLVSIADDGLQHAGQAAYLRGLLDR
ncbi:hypothetical protein GCM10010123_36720 [Pilimelia anulata]|uniref:DinB-like domain-containing protein n=1 Tax=Pilimelia anulata TaxID=53371 RepID=A0A8J3B8N1_9ACTN|nr:DinB family protein [Pilimelia anulata]GGK03441.1 hypothetical protein GCM10010123_36720 [Pilimelia anulata]